jgi:adenosylmethionine-8-amino-7-oxononanoate aminotransferase
MYQKNNLMEKIQKTSKVFENFYQEISEIDVVGDIRHKGMLMGIELVTDKSKKTPIHPKKSINKIFFEQGKKNGIYLRTLGNIIMLVPPLVISENELNSLLNRTIKTIKSAKSNIL